MESVLDAGVYVRGSKTKCLSRWRIEGRNYVLTGPRTYFAFCLFLEREKEKIRKRAGGARKSSADVRNNVKCGRGTDGFGVGC